MAACAAAATGGKGVCPARLAASAASAEMPRAARNACAVRVSRPAASSGAKAGATPPLSTPSSASAALAALPPASGPTRRALPARHAGLAQTASVGGHRVHLRTGEYADGTLGAVAIGLPREGAAFRGLMDAFAQSISLGLQHGVALEELVDTFILTRFGPAGMVEGDANVARATSILDYVFRTLAAHYLGRHDLPDAEADEPAAAEPSLPLDLPQARRGLRVIK